MIRHKSPCHTENEIEIQNVKIRTALLLIKSSSDKGFFLYHKTSAPGVGKALPCAKGIWRMGQMEGNACLWGTSVWSTDQDGPDLTHWETEN